MATYRISVQLRAPYVDNPSGIYYWTNIYYVGPILTPTDYDLARNQVFTISSHASGFATRLDAVHTVNLDTGVVVQNSNAQWPANQSLQGPTLGIHNTVRVDLYAGGVRVGYKRFRQPLRVQDIDGERLSASCMSYYQSQVVSLIESPGSYLCTRDGVDIDAARVWPLVVGWQLRHGTRRQQRRLYPL